MGDLIIRLSRDLHDDLRAYKKATGIPINDLVVRLIAGFFATGPGRGALAGKEKENAG